VKHPRRLVYETREGKPRVAWVDRADVRWVIAGEFTGRESVRVLDSDRSIERHLFGVTVDEVAQQLGLRKEPVYTSTGKCSACSRLVSFWDNKCPACGCAEIDPEPDA
jgi:hypothetical protein